MDAVALLRNLEQAEAAYRAALDACRANGSTVFRQVRQEHGWTQRELATLLGCDFSYISKIENGHYRPGKPLLRKLLKLLNAP